MSADRLRYLFVTGKLAEPALRRVLADLAPRVDFDMEVAVLPITVAALMTTDWLSRHLHLTSKFDHVILPGYCRGDLQKLEALLGIPTQLGPKDLRDLPEYFKQARADRSDYGTFDIKILAEINSAQALTRNETLRLAECYRQSGADIIDLGCDPGSTWLEVGDTVRALIDHGFRVSIDSFNDVEVRNAVEAGAERVLSVKSSNLEQARLWQDWNPEIEVVAIPDSPSDLESLDRTVEALQDWGIRSHLDPILEPIGFGFASSLGRYIEVRRRYPAAEMMMGIGNLTELTDADSVGINVLLAGFCQELGIRSVLTTQVISWACSAVKEFDLARRLVYHAVHHHVLPKRLEPELILLRDPRLYELGEESLQELARRVSDRNYRIFVERGEIHVLNGSVYLRGKDPFDLFSQMQAADQKLDLSHAFYLGYELAKAVTALTLGKNYTQDQALRWGFLTVPEVSHRSEKQVFE